MRLEYEYISISDGVRPESALGWRLNGTQTVETSHASGAAQGLVFARGSRLQRWPLTAVHDFDSVREAEEFALERHGALPNAGTLRAICGTTGDESEFTAAAILESCEIDLQGASVVINYVFAHEPFVETS